MSGQPLMAPNELAREVASEKAVAFGWHRLSMSQLAFAIASPTLSARGLIPLGTAAIVARLVHHLRAEGQLKRYATVADAPGFPGAITGVIAELRAARVRSDAVRQIAPDLVSLVEAYERELADGNFCDRSDVLHVAADAIKAPLGLGSPVCRPYCWTWRSRPKPSLPLWLSSSLSLPRCWRRRRQLIPRPSRRTYFSSSARED